MRKRSKQQQPQNPLIVTDYDFEEVSSDTPPTVVSPTQSTSPPHSPVTRLTLPEPGGSSGRIRAPSAGRTGARVNASMASDGGEGPFIVHDDDSDRGSDSGRSSGSSRSVRSSVSEGGTRLRITDIDNPNARKKFDAALTEAFRKGDVAFLCNVLGYEETIIEYCVLQKTSIVKKLLAEKPELLVEADMFIPQPGVLLNEGTTRALSKTEYIKAFTTYNTVLFDLQVSEAVRKEDKDAINALPVLRLGEAAKEACRQGKEELCAFVLERLYRGVPSAGDNPTVFGKREPVEVVERYNRAHQLALQRSKQKPTRSGSQGSAYKVGVGDFKSQCCTVQ